MVCVEDDRRITVRKKTELKLKNGARKKIAVDVGDNDADRVGAARLEAPCDQIGDIMIFLGDAANFLLRRLRVIALTVDDA